MTSSKSAIHCDIHRNRRMYGKSSVVYGDVSIASPIRSFDIDLINHATTFLKAVLNYL